MTISQEKTACSVIDGNADDGGLHFPTLAEALRYLDDRDDQHGPVPEVRELEKKCWTARCAVCGTGIGEDDDGLIHFDSAAAAAEAAEADQWTIDRDGNAHCPDDPGDEPRQPTPAELEAAGQLRLPEDDSRFLTLYTNTGAPVRYPRPKSKPSFNQSRGDGVSWARWTWNWITGCLHGCDYCYAREIATGKRFADRYPAGFTPVFHPERLAAPLHTSVPAAHRDDPAWRRVFSGSMADNYGRWVPQEWIEQGHAAMLAAPQWQYITLTKFPARYVGLDLPAGAWVGTSVDEQRRVRIAEDAFRQLRGQNIVPWLSLEPLQEPLEFTDLSMFAWVVIGARTATRQPGGTIPGFAPPFEWVARIVAQAREAGCRVHLKPNLLGRTSGQLPGMQLPDEYPAPPSPDPGAK